jgi:Na+/H+ antiporter NhaC
MTASLGVLSLIPPGVAIALALWTRRINASMLFGVLSAVVILNLQAPWLAPFRALDYMSKVASDLTNLQLIAFSLLVGGLLKLIRDAHGFTAFAEAIERVRKHYGRGTVYGLTYALGVGIFLECWSNILITGTTLAPLYDRLGISRERLAYFIHTVGLNAVAMIVINGWGAFYMSLLVAQDTAQPFQLILSALPYNLYGWACLATVAVVMATGLTIGPMKAAEAAARARREAGEIDAEDLPRAAAELGFKPRLAYMLAPLAVLIVTMVASLWLTGGGDITRGNGTASILYAVVLAMFVIGAQLIIDRVFTFGQVEEKAVQGMQEFFDISLLIVFALSLGQLCKDMGTGEFIAGVAQGALPVFLVPAVVFGLGCLMSFATGTSYGTLAVMVPLVLPMAQATGLGAPLLFAACLSGALFGDNTSPINDNSIITSMATKVSVVDHVRTQMPYALISAAIAGVGFVVVGLVAGG